jgi:alkylhydroperoxidase family enzyme
MPFLKSLPANAGPPNIFLTYPEIYRPWAEMSQALMNGDSPLEPGEREFILAYAAGVAGCEFVYRAHAEVAYAWGIEESLVERAVEDLVSAPLGAKLKALLTFVQKLVETPKQLTQDDADAVFDVGWDEHALHDAIAVVARMSFMQKLVDGCGFAPASREVAREHAKKRVKRGYVNLYRAFAKPEDATSPPPNPPSHEL